MSAEFLEKETTVCGMPVTVYSSDGWRWFSDKTQAQRCEQRRQRFLAEFAKSLRRPGTFIGGRHGERGRKRKLDDEEKRRRNQAVAETAGY